MEVDHETTKPKNEKEELQYVQGSYPLKDARMCRTFDQGHVIGKIFLVQRTITPGRIRGGPRQGPPRMPMSHLCMDERTNTSVVDMLSNGNVPQAAFLHLGKNGDAKGYTTKRLCRT